MSYKISLIPGDGVGPLLIEQATQLLTAIEGFTHYQFEFNYFNFGNAAVAEGEAPCNEERLQACCTGNAILLGNIWLKDLSGKYTASYVNAFLGKIRKELKVYANLRPIRIYPELATLSTLKNGSTWDIVVVREMAEGMLNYEHSSQVQSGERTASDLEFYDETAIRRIGQLAVEVSRLRQKKIMNVDKEIVLASSKLWRQVLDELVLNESDIKLTHTYVDDAAAQLVTQPQQFDVLLTTGMFGDILADEIAAISGVADLFPSIEMGENRKGLYTPNQIHSPAPASSQNINPLGMLMAVSWLLKNSLQLTTLSQQLDQAINQTIKQYRLTLFKEPPVTSELTAQVIQNLRKEVLQ